MFNLGTHATTGLDEFPKFLNGTPIAVIRDGGNMTIEQFNGRQDSETAQAFGLRVLAFVIRTGLLGDIPNDGLEAGIYAGAFAVANPEIAPAAAEAVTNAQLRMRRTLDVRRREAREALLRLGFTDEPIVHAEGSHEARPGVSGLSSVEIEFVKNLFREFHNGDDGGGGRKVKRPTPRPSLPPSGVANPF